MSCTPFESIRSYVTVAVISAAMAAGVSARGDDVDTRAPEVPAAIKVPVGNTLYIHVYAVGVQIYKWDGASWVFEAPEAMLYYGNGNLVGIHYAGPTWESTTGSKAVGVRVDSAPSPNPNSIPMLWLRAESAEGRGIFAFTTHVQRLNTVGGVAPSAPGSVIGEEFRSPYSAEYYFYRKEKAGPHHGRTCPP